MYMYMYQPGRLPVGTAVLTVKFCVCLYIDYLYAHVHFYNQYYKLDRCESVCVSVTDVTSLLQRVLWERGYNVYHNAYAGNESPS